MEGGMTEHDANTPGRAKARRLSTWLVAFLGYFGLGLLPKAVPALGGSPLFLLYVLSIPVALLILAGLFAFGVVSVVTAKRRGLPEPRSYRLPISAAVLGGACFVVFIALLRLLPASLPTGSHLLPFESAAWLVPESAAYADGQPTKRQKMLGSLLEQLNPTLTRADVEAMLGEPHPRDFPLGIRDSDIHYMTGPQRDAFFGLDSEWLLLWFDESGHFEHYELYVD